MLQHVGAPGLACLLLLYPLSHVAHLLADTVWFVLNMSFLDLAAAEVWGSQLSNIVYRFENNFLWAAATAFVVLLGWPFIARFWWAIFDRQRGAGSDRQAHLFTISWMAAPPAART